MLEQLKTASLLLALAFLPLLEAKIDEVEITWTAALCEQSCATALEAQFRKIPAVAAIEMNRPGGRVRLKWRPEAPFTFSPINTAMSMIGLSINELRVKVSGYITHHGNEVTLVSDPDGSRFTLKSPTPPVYNQYVEQYNIYGYSLSSEMRQELLEAEEKGLKVVITGKIFEPERSPPLVLIIARSQVIHPTPAPAQSKP